jgi:hypothetical protein
VTSADFFGLAIFLRVNRDSDHGGPARRICRNTLPLRHIACPYLEEQHHGGRPRELESWEGYFRADLRLNHCFFLEEARRVGLFQGALPPIGMKFLRDGTRHPSSMMRVTARSVGAGRLYSGPGST